MPVDPLDNFGINKRRKKVDAFAVDSEAYITRDCSDALSLGLPTAVQGQKVLIRGITEHDGNDLLVVHPEGGIPMYVTKDDLTLTPPRDRVPEK